MAYSKKFSPIGGQSTRGASPQMFSYLSGIDTSAEIEVAGYFNLARTYLERNDIIIAIDSTGNSVFYRVSLVPINGNVEIENIDAGGSLTSISVATANGFSGTVTNPTTTPEITIKTTETGILRGDGASISSTLISEDDLSFTDTSTANASTTKHGLLPKLSNSSTQFLNGEGNWITPSGIANSYVSQSFTAQTSVTVTHNFGAYPVVQVTLDSGADKVVTVPYTITHTSANAFIVTFTTSSSGVIIATVGSPQLASYITVSDNYTLTGNDYFVECTEENKTITLPTAIGRQGQIFNIDNSSIGDIDIATTGGQTIHGNAIITIPSSAVLTVVSNGSNWRIN